MWGVESLVVGCAYGGVGWVKRRWGTAQHQSKLSLRTYACALCGVWLPTLQEIRVPIYTSYRCIPIPSTCVAASSGTCKTHICGTLFAYVGYHMAYDITSCHIIAQFPVQVMNSCTH